MGAPNIVVSFIEKAQQTIRRGEQGIIAMILKDSGVDAGAFVVYTADDIPAGLSDGSKDQLRYALLGYETGPKKIIVYVIANATGYSDALAYLATQKFNWLVCPSVSTDSKTSDIVAWIKTQRSDNHAVYKAVLPNTEADCEAIVNVANGYKIGTTSITAEQACARVAGIICGTSSHRSCTYAPLLEATDCDRLTQAQLDTAVDAGKLVFMWDGEKVKICRGVTSFVTNTLTKGDSYKKIRLVETMDMIYDDIRMTAQDRFIGKYPNTYDAKCVLISAINAYFQELSRDYILQGGFAEIDVSKNLEWIKAHNDTVLVEVANGMIEVPLEDATDQQIKEAVTGSNVYLRAVIRLVDAIEDIYLDIYI